jgi:RNA polymerase sigma-70 factor (ECF subfamily)
VLWHKADLYDATRSSLSTWLFRIARNRRIDLQRRARARILDEDDPALQPTAEIGADELVANGDRDAQVREAVSQLPEEQREMLRAAFFLGQSHSEIAESTGLPLGTVKSRIRLAFGKLKKVLEAENA